MLNEMFDTILGLSLAGSFMICGAYLLRGVLGRRGRIGRSAFVFLWLLVFLRLLVPFSIEVPAGLLPDGLFSINGVTEWEGAVRENPVPAPGGTETVGVNNMPEAGEGIKAHRPEMMAADGLEPQGETQEKDSGERGFFNTESKSLIYDTIPIIWLGGVILMGIVIFGAYGFALARSAGAAASFPEGWEKIKAESGVRRRVGVYESRGISSPAVYGIFFPRIMLPEGGNRGREGRNSHILLHELIHIKRYDNLKKIASMAVLCLHWFNPLVWLCCASFQKDLEYACDEGVIELIGYGQRKSYAASLYEFAEQRYGFGAGGLAFGEIGAMGRVKRILDYQGSSGVKPAAAAALLLFLITGCAAGQAGENPAKSPEDSRLVYAAADGLYERNLGDGESRKIYDGTALSHPVFSGDGTRLIFKQTLQQTPEEEEAGTDRTVLYVHDFQRGQTIKLLENPVSYCAGPGGSFLVSTADGQVMKADFELGEGESGPDLVPEMETISPGAEAVPDKASITAVLYENLKPSQDFRYLAYNIRVYDEYIVDASWAEGHHSGTYSGGLYLLDLETTETSLVVEPILSHKVESGMGNNPEPGPWSRDGKTLWVWDKPQSASLTADGANGFFYHVDTGKKTEYGGSLAYDENISYSGKGTAAVLGGGGRDMFVGKWLDFIEDYSGAQGESAMLEEIEKAGLIPAMPQLSENGDRLYFAAIEKQSLKKGYDEGKWTGDDYNQVYPLKRQLYVMELSGGRTITPITSDPAYRCESPVLLKNEKYLVFGRGNAQAYDGKMEIWMASVDGKQEIKLAEWTEQDGADAWASDRYDDYYGRGNWHGIFAVYGASE